MSKASREFKENKKCRNLMFPTPTHLKKDMTLKAYRKWCREIRTYETGIKQHVACFKGRVK